MYYRVMKKSLRISAFLALGVIALASCNGKEDLDVISKEEAALKSVMEQYVPNVIYDIYGNLADKTESLWGQLVALRDAGP